MILDIAALVSRAQRHGCLATAVVPVWYIYCRLDRG
jgi:hypothetical protein